MPNANWGGIFPCCGWPPPLDAEVPFWCGFWPLVGAGGCCCWDGGGGGDELVLSIFIFAVDVSCSVTSDLLWWLLFWLQLLLLLLVLLFNIFWVWDEGDSSLGDNCPRPSFPPNEEPNGRPDNVSPVRS